MKYLFSFIEKVFIFKKIIKKIINNRIDKQKV